MRYLAVSALLPFALFGWQWWGDHTIENRLAPIASGVAGRTVTVDCQSVWGELLDAQWREGEVRFDSSGAPEPRLFLTRRICKRLREFSERRTHPQLDCLRTVDWAASPPLRFDSPCYEESADTIYAFLILAHESYHTAGVGGEATANCFAIQAIGWAATQLRATPDEARLLARAMEALEPMQSSGYETTQCHAGLALDLHPETPEFPTEQQIAPPLGRGGSLAGRAA